MKPFFNIRHTRYTAIAMVFVWLMTLGIGMANACLVKGAQERHTSAALVQETHHEDGHGHSVSADKAVCLTVCDAEQSIAVKIKKADLASDSQTLQYAYYSFLTLAVVDLHDRFEPSDGPPGREIPVSIRFLRLTI